MKGFSLSALPGKDALADHNEAVSESEDTSAPARPLRVAASVGPRLRRGLAESCCVLLLTADNWETTLEYGQPDMLLVEAGFPIMENLRETVALNQQMRQKAEELSTPTALWITDHPQNPSRQKKLADDFDFVFCADQRLLEEFGSSNKHCHLLPPASDTQTFPPLARQHGREGRPFKALCESLRNAALPEHRGLFLELQQGGLTLLPGAQSSTRREAELKYLEESLEPAAPESSFRDIVQNHSLYISMSEPTPEGSLYSTWRSLEALCSGIPVLHYGEMHDDDIRKPFVHAYSAPDDFLAHVAALQKDSHYQRESAALGCEEILKRHTLSHRLAQMANVMGLDTLLPLQKKSVSLLCEVQSSDEISSVLSFLRGGSQEINEVLILAEDSVDAEEAFQDPKLQFTPLFDGASPKDALKLALENATGHITVRAKGLHNGDSLASVVHLFNSSIKTVAEQGNKASTQDHIGASPYAVRAAKTDLWTDGFDKDTQQDSGSFDRIVPSLDLAESPDLPMVSIVIPVYNMEDFLSPALDSAISQTHPCTEIVVVNDGSTDNSLEIIERYARVCPIFKVINRENGGLSIARNTGLLEASGEYVIFHDADDTLLPNAVEALLAKSRQGNHAITGGIFCRVANGQEKLDKRFLTNETIRDFSNDIPLAIKHCTNFSCCNKLFRKDFLEKHAMQFSSGRYMQDIEFWLKCMALKESFHQSDVIVSKYIKHEGSFSTRINPERIQSCFDIFDHVEEFYAERCKDLRVCRDIALINGGIYFFVKKILLGHEIESADEYLQRFSLLLKKMPENSFIAHFNENKSRAPLACYCLREGLHEAARFFAEDDFDTAKFHLCQKHFGTADDLRAFIDSATASLTQTRMVQQ